jgi:arylsulfatase A-like enzyme
MFCMKIEANKNSLLTNYILLTLLFFVVQAILLMTHILVAVGADNFFQAQIITSIFHSSYLLQPLLAWLLFQIILYACFITVLWCTTLLCGEFFKLNKSAVQYLGMFIWCLAVFGILVANNWVYPHSWYSLLTNKYLLTTPLSVKEYWQILSAVLLFFVFLTVVCAVQLIKVILQKKIRLQHKVAMAIVMILLVFEGVSSYQPAPQQWHAATKAKPNIILIGLDAARPDFFDQEAVTPNIINFLKESANFNNAMTVIAQTMPAWVTILTSTPPKINLARENLAALDKIYRTDTLGKRLQGLGYETVFATDDNLFNSINESFGFDKLVGPRTGIAEFVIGEFNDMPLSNLLLRSALGKQFLPFNYANHEAAATYDPDNFLQLIQDQLNQPQAKPLFLAVHFNLGGWPFGWYDSAEAMQGVWYYRYAESLRAVDAQFEKFMSLLQQHNLLTNSIVVLLSDHGATLGLPHDRSLNEELYQGDKTKLSAMDKTLLLPNLHLSSKPTLSTSYGYGSDLFSWPQLHVLLAFKGYGVELPQGVFSQQSTLLDVAPTLLSLLGQPPLAAQEGLSLLSKNNVGPVQREFFLETSAGSFLGTPTELALDFSLQNLVHDYALAKNSNAIQIRPEGERVLLLAKQRGILLGNWMLVEMPGKHFTRYTKDAVNKNKIEMTKVHAPSYMVLLDVNSGKWTMELNSAWARLAPVATLCEKLFTFYGNELQCKDCCPRG